MRAILIDPFKESVTAIETKAGLDDLYEILKCDLITVIRWDKGNALIIDDEGLLLDKEDQEYWWVSGYDQPFAGRGIIIGDSYGENKSTDLKIEDIVPLISFPDKDGIDPQSYIKWEITTF